MCKIKGCKKKSAYKSQDVCQMHYFRFMRYGTYELVRKGKGRKEEITPNGYKRIFKPDHPLRDKNGFVFEHRYQLYLVIGDEPTFCDFCGKPWNWNGRHDHVDHINKNKLDNRLENLRPLCNGCNVSRTKKIYNRIPKALKENI